ncbi:MAG: hypothetical protein QG646_3161 [Euryarchaeota archaeon]|nr:hypothetical protein [Euryarchaeota archaeon]
MQVCNKFRSNNSEVISLTKEHFTAEEAKEVGEKIGIKWDKFDVDQFRRGMDVELEHGTIDPSTNVTNDDPILTGKIALAHLNEFPDYYDRLEEMEDKAEEFWEKKKN